LLPASLGLLATGLGRARAALRLRFPDAGERRRVLDEALAQGGALDPLDASSADRIEGWLDGAPPAPPDTVELRIAGDDPDGLTLRQARLLGSADVVVHEPGVSPAILERARADAARVVIAPGDPAPAIAGLVIVLRD